MTPFEAAMKNNDALLRAVTDPEERTCFNCGNEECRNVQRKTCDLKETTCPKWEHDFQAMRGEVRGAFRS